MKDLDFIRENLVESSLGKNLYPGMCISSPLDIYRSTFKNIGCTPKRIDDLAVKAVRCSRRNNKPIAFYAVMTAGAISFNQIQHKGLWAGRSRDDNSMITTDCSVVLSALVAAPSGEGKSDSLKLPTELAARIQANVFHKLNSREQLNLEMYKSENCLMVVDEAASWLDTKKTKNEHAQGMDEAAMNIASGH